MTALALIGREIFQGF